MTFFNCKKKKFPDDSVLLISLIKQFTWGMPSITININMSNNFRSNNSRSITEDTVITDRVFNENVGMEFNETLSGPLKFVCLNPTCS